MYLEQAPALTLLASPRLASQGCTPGATAVGCPDAGLARVEAPWRGARATLGGAPLCDLSDKLGGASARVAAVAPIDRLTQLALDQPCARRAHAELPVRPCIWLWLARSVLDCGAVMDAGVIDPATAADRDGREQQGRDTDCFHRRRSDSIVAPVALSRTKPGLVALVALGGRVGKGRPRSHGGQMRGMVSRLLRRKTLKSALSTVMTLCRG
jgi:hypothetical protein